MIFEHGFSRSFAAAFEIFIKQGKALAEAQRLAQETLRNHWKLPGNTQNQPYKLNSNYHAYFEQTREQAQRHLKAAARKRARKQHAVLKQEKRCAA